MRTDIPLTSPMEGLAGLKIRADNGAQAYPFPEMMSTPLFYLARPGDRLCLLDEAYRYTVATYSPEIDPRWVYTYDYAPDQSWTVYRHDVSDDSYRQDAYIFTESVYFRVCLRKADGGLFDGSEDMGTILRWEVAAVVPVTLEAPTPPDIPVAAVAPETTVSPVDSAAPAALSSHAPVRTKAWIIQEAEGVARRVDALCRPGDQVFALLTDSHYTVNGTWADTVAALGETHQRLGFDGVIHLGDFTDGMVTGAVTRRYVGRILADLNALGVPVWVAIGNHDTNYFRNNPDRFSFLEQGRLYLGKDEPRYVVDFDARGLRFIFLDSFDPNEELRYGYSPACVAWLDRQLTATPKGWRVMVFSHLPPETRLQYWVKSIRGEADIMGVLNAHADKIVAFINGHNHADRLDNAGSFPVISIGNAKCESFLTHKPADFFTPERRLGEAAQELWDVMLVSAAERAVRLVRFGAGKDRCIENGRADWL